MLNPLLLLFLPLALVPILLHLITLHRLRTVELSTFRFLMDSYIQQRRKLRLLEFLLMILRVLFVALVVFSLSRPEVKGFARLFGGGSGRDVSIVIDSGPSMALRTDGTLSLERAKEAARTMIGLLERDDHVTLIRAGGRPEILCRGFAGQPEPIIDQIDRIRTSAAGSDLAAALRKVYGTRRHGPRIVYVLSDGRKTTWSALRNDPVLNQIDADGQLVVMDLGPGRDVPNLAVVGDAPQSLRPIVGLPIRLNATVFNSSTEKSADTVLSVVLDEEVVTRINLALQPGQRHRRPIAITPGRPGVLRGRFELPGDAFSEDNAFLFCLNVDPDVAVLVVSGTTDPEAAPSDDPGLYINAALKSPLNSESGLQAKVKPIASALRITRVKQDKLSAGLLKAADVVVLADVKMDAARGAMLRQHVTDGGGLLVLPGPGTDAASLNEHLIGHGGAAGKLNILMDPPEGDPDDESRFVPISSVQLAHPVLNVFAGTDTRYFGTARLYRFFPLKVESELPGAAVPGPAPSSLLELPDGRSVLVEINDGRGRILIAGFAATPNWSNLPLKPEFVPMLLRAVAHLRRPTRAQAPVNIRPGEPAPLYLSDKWARAQVQAIDPNEKPTSIQMHRSGDKFAGALTGTEDKGYYRFNILPRADGAPQNLDLGFAVNLDPDESDFSRLDEAKMRTLLHPLKMTYLKGSSNDPVLKEQLTRKREIWRALIWMTFIVIGIEFGLATWRPQVDDEPTGGPLKRLGGRLGAIMGQAPVEKPLKASIEN